MILRAHRRGKVKPVDIARRLFKMAANLRLAAARSKSPAPAYVRGNFTPSEGTPLLLARHGMEPRIFSRRFLLLFITDLIARTGYQIGKSPVLPVLALALGAGDALLGLIVSVSTATGMVAKPLIGHLADRHGRYRFLLAAMALLIVPCFFYPLLTSPSQLVGLRLVHGLTTAILGPVSLSLLVDEGEHAKAELFGWFGLARQTGYVLGPLIGGLMLSLVAPANVYLAIALISAFAVLTAILFRPHCADADYRRGERRSVNFRSFVSDALSVASQASVLAAAIFEMTGFMALYFYKAFLPVLALGAGVPILEVGAFLALQELVTAILKPVMGRLADRSGHRRILAFGLIAVGFVLVFVPAMLSLGWFVLLAVLLGSSQAIVQPALLAVLSATDIQNRTFAYGLVGGCRNAGKVLGPLAGGVLYFYIDPAASFLVIGMVPVFLGIMLVFDGNSTADLSEIRVES